MAYCQTDLVEVLQAIVQRLIDQAGFSEHNCVIALSRPEELPMLGGDEEGVFAIVYPGPGTFDQPMLDGGSIHQCNENTSLNVEIYSPVLLDQQGQDREILLSAGRGVIAKCKDILKALVGHMLTSQHGDSTDEILRQPLLPTSRGNPLGGSGELGSITLTFESMYEWNLS